MDSATENNEQVERHVPDKELASVSVRGVKVRQAKKGEEKTALGDAYFYSVPYSFEVEDKKLRDEAERHHIPGTWLPEPLKGINAFKRATEVLAGDHRFGQDEETEKPKPQPKRGKTKVSVTKEEEVAREQIWVREAPGHPLLRHIVKEIRVGAKKPEFTVLGHVEFSAKCKVCSHVVGSGDQHPNNHSPEYVGASISGKFDAKRSEDRDKFDGMVLQVQEKLEHFSNVYIDRDVRNILERARRQMKVILLRDSGGVYFSPIDQRESLVHLRDFIKAIKCKFWTIPLSASEMDPSDIGEKLVDAVGDETEVLLRKVETILDAGKQITADRETRMLADLAEVERLVKHYDGLLKVDLNAAVRKIEATKKKLAELEKLVIKG